jgi:hypothetical protein
LIANPQPIATRASWKTHACSEQREALSLAAVYSPSEFEQIKAGLIPEEMEDKWFIFFEAPWLYLHRSWTGFCIYGVRFDISSQGAVITESWVSRKKDQYRGTDTVHEQRLLKFLIDALLLKKLVAYPMPADAGETLEARVIHQHAVVGCVCPETLEPVVPPKRSLWRRITGRFNQHRP